MKKKPFIMLAFAGCLLGLGIVAFSPKPPPDGRAFFETVFETKLPSEISVLYGEEEHNLMGDGHRLYVYQLKAAGMEELLAQESIGIWRSLPFPSTLAGNIKALTNLSSPRSEEVLDMLGAKKGFYILINTKNHFLLTANQYDNSDTSLHDVALGVINITKNKVYLYTWNQ